MAAGGNQTSRASTRRAVQAPLADPTAPVTPSVAKRSSRSEPSGDRIGPVHTLTFAEIEQAQIRLPPENSGGVCVRPVALSRLQGPRPARDCFAAKSVARPAAPRRRELLAASARPGSAEHVVRVPSEDTDRVRAHRPPESDRRRGHHGAPCDECRISDRASREDGGARDRQRAQAVDESVLEIVGGRCCRSHGRHQHASGDVPEHEVVDVARSTDVDRAPGTVKRVTSGAHEALGEGPLTFAAVVGGLLAVPGPFDLLAFGPMARGGYTTFELGVLIVVFTLIKLVLIEVPIVSYAISPASMSARVSRFSNWIAANKLEVIAAVVALIGVVLTVRGIASIV